MLNTSTLWWGEREGKKDDVNSYKLSWLEWIHIILLPIILLTTFLVCSFLHSIHHPSSLDCLISLYFSVLLFLFFIQVEFSELCYFMLSLLSYPLSSSSFHFFWFLSAVVFSHLPTLHLNNLPLPLVLSSPLLCSPLLSYPSLFSISCFMFLLLLIPICSCLLSSANSPPE